MIASVVSDEALWRLRHLLLTHDANEKRRSFKSNQSAFYGWVLVVVHQGRFDYEISGERGEAGFGDIVVCRPEVSWWRQVKTPTLSYHTFEFLWRDESGQFVEPRRMPVGKITIQDTARLQSNLLALGDMAESSSFAQTGQAPTGVGPFAPVDAALSQWHHARAAHVLEDILQLFYAQTMQARQQAQQSHSDELMEEAMRYLQENAGQPLSMKALARSLGLSPVQLSRRFQQKFHTSPSDYLASLRMSMARNLLLETDLTIHEVAQKCGYQNGFYLSNLFASKLKITPGQFRKSQRARL